VYLYVSGVCVCVCVFVCVCVCMYVCVYIYIYIIDGEISVVVHRIPSSHCFLHTLPFPPLREGPSPPKRFKSPQKVVCTHAHGRCILETHLSCLVKRNI